MEIGYYSATVASGNGNGAIKEFKDAAGRKVKEYM